MDCTCHITGGHNKDDKFVAESFFDPMNELDPEKKLVELYMFDEASVCRKAKKNWRLSILFFHVFLEYSIPVIMCLKGGGLLRKHLNCAKKTRCVELVKNRNLGNYYLKNSLYPFFPPFCSTIHWFPSSPRQYTGSLVETSIMGQIDKKLTSMLVIWTFLSFELADIF